MRHLLFALLCSLAACAANEDTSEIDDADTKGDSDADSRPRGTFERVSGDAPFAELVLRLDDVWLSGETEGEIRWSRSTTTDARFLRLFEGGELLHRFAWSLRGDELTLRDTTSDAKSTYRRAEQGACREDYSEDCFLQGYAGDPSCLGSWSCDGGCNFHCEVRNQDALLHCNAERVFSYSVFEESLTEWEYPSIYVERAGEQLEVSIGGSGYSTADKDAITEVGPGEWVVVPFVEDGGGEGFRIVVAPGATAQRFGTLFHRETPRSDWTPLAEIRCW